MYAALLGLPSLHEIIEAIAHGFFEALAGALVPGFLKHATVATIQHLVALPDPQSWQHLSSLEGQMIYLGAALLPVSLAASTLRYWVSGLTGAAHPAGALARCVGAAGTLVAYRWMLEQVIAAANTLTHAILGFPAVGDGLGAIVSVLFGGALLTGSASVFGALLVIVGVLFAAGLFALQVLLTLLFALLCTAGPPLIALSPIPECEHLLRSWAHGLGAIALVPVGWTLLFATAGALSLDAVSLDGASGGLPGHIAAAFAGLATFAIAVKLPLMLLGEARRFLSSARLRSPAGPNAPPRAISGSERVRAAHARLRSAALVGVPALAGSIGMAAGSLGAPAGGPLGAATRGLKRAVKTGPLRTEGSDPPAAQSGTQSEARPARRGLRTRLADAGAILARAPREARRAVLRSSMEAPSAPTSVRQDTPNAATNGSTRKPAEPPRPRAPERSPRAQASGMPAAPTASSTPSSSAQAQTRSGATRAPTATPPSDRTAAPQSNEPRNPSKPPAPTHHQHPSTPVPHDGAPRPAPEAPSGPRRRPRKPRGSAER